MHESMPALSYIQMGQSVIVVTWLPGHSIVRKGTNVAAAEPPLHTDLIRRDQFHGFISFEDVKLSQHINNVKSNVKKQGKREDLISSRVIYATTMCLFLAVESILDETVR